MAICGPFIDYCADGLASRMAYFWAENVPDFTCRWLCPLCWANTGWERGGHGGHCGTCGQTFVGEAVRDRSPLVIQ